MSERVQYLQQQAAKARRLAKSLPNDEVSKKLLKLAEEYDALAKKEEQVVEERRVAQSQSYREVPHVLHPGRARRERS